MSNGSNGTGLVRKKVRISPSFVSATKDVVGSSNGYTDNENNIMNLLTEYEFQQKMLSSWYVL